MGKISLIRSGIALVFAIAAYRLGTIDELGVLLSVPFVALASFYAHGAYTSAVNEHRIAGRPASLTEVLMLDRPWVSGAVASVLAIAAVRTWFSFGGGLTDLATAVGVTALAIACAQQALRGRRQRS